MAYEHIRVATEDAVGMVTLNRPQVLNALNQALMTELAAALEEFDRAAGVRCIVLTGSDRAFAAGADVREFAEATSVDMVRSYRFQQWDRIRRIGTPIIAAVSGFALGGGCELAMACHIRIASDNAKFGQPEVKLGIAPGYGGTQRLPRLVGKGIAMQLILTGEMIDAQAAYRIGLVNKVVPAADLLAESEKMMRGILAMGPLAVRLSIEAIDQGTEMTLDEGLLLEANHFGLLAATQDMKEGTTAFLEKRSAKFQGR